jgi:hypothetical protein
VLDKLTHDDFFKCLHQKFQAHHDGGTLEFELIECRTLITPRGDGAQRAPFAVIFRGPHQPVLAQRIYKLEGGLVGPLEIFIVPVGPDVSGMRYEAVFS